MTTPTIKTDCDITLTHLDVNSGQPYGFLILPADKYGARVAVQRIIETDGTITQKFFFKVVLADGLINPDGSDHGKTRAEMYDMLCQYLSKTTGLILGTVMGNYPNMSAVGFSATEHHYGEISYVAVQMNNSGFYFKPADPATYNNSVWDGTLTWSTSCWR
jgi:hypothetical protein